MTLRYADGGMSLVPLIVGKQIDTLFSHFAEETIPVKIETDVFHRTTLKCSGWLAVPTGYCMILRLK
ncbi:hypothetical protein [Paenibacillus sp. N3.4]|uniref:hypothetical protein n=1 Tax=Paenibacillus sp. N3.4 TaxID=2603222 RepID=UPI0011D4B6FD|nr:hypothetical protein [Paenibacillus sp. N3.4]TXK84166.1 hypothetical protein FU659_09935 [Paenibacillus sp. N3.4]